MLSPAYVFGMSWLVPYLNDPNAREISVPLFPGTYARGTVLGQINAANVSDVQTVNITGGPTSSTVTLSGLPGGGSATLPQNATPAQAQAAINAVAGPGAVVVSGAGGAAGGYVLTWSGSYANRAVGLVSATGVFVGGATPAVAVVHTTTGVGPNGVYAPYASGNTDGTGSPKVILQYPCVANADGSIQVSAEVPGFSELVVPAYYRGTFRCEELVGLDAAAVVSLGGHLAGGNTSFGTFTF